MSAIWAHNLLKLQTLDLELRNLKTRFGELPQEAAAIKAKIAKLESGVKAAKAAKAAHERELAANDSEAAGLQAKLAKLREQSDLVKSNTEYQAMLSSIAMLEHAIGELETKSLELMDAIEADSRKIRDAEEKFRIDSKSHREELKELVELADSIKVRFEELKKQRPELYSMVDGEVLSRYELILKKNAGIPLVPVEADKCGHCHLRLTPQTLAQAKNGSIAYCDNCMHIIYAPEAE